MAGLINGIRSIAHRLAVAATFLRAVTAESTPGPWHHATHYDWD